MDMREYLKELVSALQKFIRRNMEYEAVHVAVELEASFHYNILWNRLRIIASEDCGSNLLMPILVETLYKHYEREKTKVGKEPNDNSHLLFVSNAVICLCHSPKNRSADDLLNVVLLEREKGIGVPIPDYALDMHTKRGREMGRGYEHFFYEGSKVENESGSNPWKEKHRELRKV